MNEFEILLRQAPTIAKVRIIAALYELLNRLDKGGQANFDDITRRRAEEAMARHDRLAQAA